MPNNQSTYVARPLAGLPLEAELVAMREILPAAVATLSLADGSGEVQIVTFLPGMERAFRRPDGTAVIAMQPATRSDDLSQDLGNALVAALEAEPGQGAEPRPLGEPGPRLQELVDPAGPTSFELKDSFEFWTDLDPDNQELADAAVQSAKELTPTETVGDISGAYWAEINGREFLRWSAGIEEDRLLDALARLQAKRQAGVVEGAKYAGAFRALGLVIPVWELPRGTQAEDLAEPLTEFQAKLDAALADESPLDANERRSRAGLVARFLTLR
ncbi:MAG: DUF5926 family protein [Bifidobacteriaceae bacterium]|jgi:hypothetical protein|nr:DUF5926 family protein [Bifidobacteriaceae bacterium]